MERKLKAYAPGDPAAVEKLKTQIAWRSERWVEIAVERPRQPHTVIVLAHGAGGRLTDPMLEMLAQGLAQEQVATLRFNFPYRQEGRRIPDPAATLEECYRAVVAHAREEFPGTRLVLGGKSMGGRMASHLAAAGEDLSGLVFLSYPLHPPGRPEKLRDQHLYQIRAPLLFISGTRDSFAHQELLERTLERLRPQATVHWLEGGDHSLRVTRRDVAAVQQEILECVRDWLPRLSH